MKGLLLLVRELWFMKKTLKRHGRLLRRGRYYVYPSMRAIVLCDDIAKRNADPYFDKNAKKGKAARIIHLLNTIGFFRNRAKSTEQYEALYIANNYDAVRETKLFAFETGKVLVFCVNEEERQNVLALHDRLRGTYPMPTVRAMPMPCAYETSLIRLVVRPSERDAIQSIATATAAHVSDTDLKTERLSELTTCVCDDADEATIMSQLRSRISADVLEMTVPLCAQHGDLSTDNLIYGKTDSTEGFFWIDWEHLGDRVFFYDCFFYILNTAVYSPESPVLREFLTGEYDEMLTAFFAAFGLSYVPEKKREWFLAFCILSLKERVVGLGRTAALRMYRDFLFNNV